MPLSLEVATFSNEADSVFDGATTVKADGSTFLPHPVTGADVDELPETTYTCYCYDFVVEAVFMGVLCLFGFAGNVVATACLRRDRSKTATPFLLISLEVADTLFLVAVFGLRVLTSVDTFAVSLPWLEPVIPFMGKFVYPAALVTMTGTIYLTILVTVNRYVSVCWPYRASDWCSVRCARLHVTAVVAFSIVFNLPRFFEYDIIYVDTTKIHTKTSNGSSVSGNETSDSIPPELMAATVLPTAASMLQQLFHNSPIASVSTPATTSSLTDGSVAAAEISRPTLQKTPMAQHHVYQLVYTNFLYFIVMFLFPLGSLMFLNQRLIVALRRTRKKRQGMQLGKVTVANAGSSKTIGSNAADANKSEEDITFMLIVVVMVFVVTQTPAAVTQMMESWLDERSLVCPAAFFFYVRISDLLVVANSSLNFVIYCLCSRRFRQILTDVVCRCPRAGSDSVEGSDRRISVTNGGRRAQSRCPAANRRAPGLTVVGNMLAPAKCGRTPSTTQLDATVAVPLTRAVSEDGELISSI